MAERVNRMLLFEVAVSVIAMRKYRGLTVEQFAKKAKLAPSTVERIESSRPTNLRLDGFRRLVDALGGRLTLDMRAEAHDDEG